MGWDYIKFEATCDDCGKKGFCIRGSDDWMRSSTDWEGFDIKDPDPQDVARKRRDSRSAIPVCSCGSTNITVGAFVS